MGRPKHEPTDKTRDTVKIHATIGTNQEIIADILEIDAKTLRKHYRAELEQSRSKANAVVGGSLYNKATGGDTAAMIFWMKTQAGWRETQDFNIKAAEPFTHLVLTDASNTPDTD